MDNSALTRQATRARIGPWYVMQSRNPSAPGMKCNTLLALIRKGQITPRSVVRGPTTFQLWRFAARVKGISREFGLCYSCGAELQRTSTFCPRCSRSQELPPNPDGLLENEPQAAKTVYRQVNPRPETPEPIGPDKPQASPPRQTPAVETDSNRQARPSTQIPTAAETMAELAEIPSPHKAPPEMQSRPRQRPQEGILTPRELAAAFSIQYDPTMDASSKLRRGGGGGKNLLVVVLLLMLLGGGISIFYFVPSLRQRFIAWVQNSEPAPAVVPQNPPNQQKSVPDVNPAWMNYVPDETPPITTPAKLSSSGSATASSASNSSGTATPSNTLAIANHPAVSAPIPPPPAPAPVIDTPVTTSTPIDPTTAAAADAASKLRQSTNDLDTLAMKLRNNGLDAEARHDYAAALYYYQQVETLPTDHWPGGIDLLLKNAQKRLGGGGRR
jgi:hypothetical protein